MNNLDSLLTLLHQAERERDFALAEQQKVQAAHDAAKAQAQQLVTYRREYEQRWSEQFCREGKIELVRCYQGFVQRLTQAVDQQARVADHAANQLARASANVRECEVRAAAVRKLIERRTHEGQLAAERREQKQSDELAARATWGRGATLRASSAF
ncbi:flagellar export protein FliJ [Piscinibacter koreensis]|uniref:Flagellar FliJ protein n=1 Tax=Piscinibacter koreensis TaxID=2742824 RepID=A0A7Y6NMK1_9BURK|nr:flagellar export protein FliJ [Schlegelella koreensis]NUZ05935.1 flagellar export protein FliJ [Schlegelella koreensis]